MRLFVVFDFPFVFDSRGKGISNRSWQSMTNNYNGEIHTPIVQKNF